MTTDISGLDKVELLEALWKNQKEAAFFNGFNTAPAFDREQAKKAVKKSIDYFCGRSIKLDLSKDKVNFQWYDRDSKKAGAEVVATLRGGAKIRTKNDTEHACRFSAFGGPMLDGDPGTVMCGHCGRWKKHHWNS